MPKTRTRHTSHSDRSASASASTDARRLQSRAEDSSLIRRALAGDQRAFQRLRQKYHDAIFQLVQRMIRDRQDVEDLTQEAFIKAFSSLANFNEEYAFSTWLYKIATNNAIDHIRRKKLPTFSIDKPVESVESDFTFELPDTEPEPDEEIIERQRRSMLQDAMNSLPPRYRQVILLRHVEEKEYAEIAAILGLPLGTVKAHIFRAREMLYKQLRDKMRHY